MEEQGTQTETGGQEEENPATSSRAYTTRGQNRGEEVALDVRLRSGDAWAFPYSYLMALHFNADGVLFLFFSTHHLEVRGRNLRPLYELLQQRQVLWMQEGSDRYDEGDESETFISSIEITELR